jgi:hypothetical protein
MEPVNYTVKSYTNDAWTNLAAEPSELDVIVVANTTVGSLTAQIRIASNAGTERAVILPATAISANSAHTLDIKSLKLGRTDVLQVKGSAAGLHFTASGGRLEDWTWQS